jgi:hypothetical protein
VNFNCLRNKHEEKVYVLFSRDVSHINGVMLQRILKFRIDRTALETEGTWNIQNKEFGQKTILHYPLRVWDYQPFYTKHRDLLLRNYTKSQTWGRYRDLTYTGNRRHSMRTGRERGETKRIIFGFSFFAYIASLKETRKLWWTMHVAWEWNLLLYGTKFMREKSFSNTMSCAFNKVHYKYLTISLHITKHKNVWVTGPDS